MRQNIMTDIQEAKGPNIYFKGIPSIASIHYTCVLKIHYLPVFWRPSLASEPLEDI
jgi:hypothetical protein